MTERDPSTRAVPAGGPGDWREDTTPGLAPVTGATAVGPGHAGLPATGPVGYAPVGAPARPTPVRGPASLAGLLLILAGISGAVSLALRWLRDRSEIGWDLLRRGFDELGGGFRAVVDSGAWQPPAVVLGGGVLLLLGILLWLPARTHRFLGLLALAVSGLVLAAVLVPFAAEDWDPAAFGLGFWFACAVAVLGLLGALIAMLRGPRFR
jgi:hypothetical protein